MRCLRILHDNGFTNEEYLQQKAVVYANTIMGMVSMLEAMRKLEIPFEKPESEVHVVH